jgi:cytochrome c
MKNTFQVSLRAIQTALLVGCSVVALQVNAEGVPPAMKAAKANPAPAAYAICSACHSVSPSGDSSIGPNLHSVVGRTAGTLPGFNYSAAMKKSGIVWTPEELNSFLINASAKVPGTLMTYNGVADEKSRTEIIKYLQSLIQR